MPLGISGDTSVICAGNGDNDKFFVLRFVPEPAKGMCVNMKNKGTALLLLAAIIFLSAARVCYGNSAEPPSVTFIVPNAPEDLEISVDTGGTIQKAEKNEFVFESHYTLYSHDLGEDIPVFLIRTTGGKINYNITIDEFPKRYNNIYTLDLKEQTLSEGKSWARSVILVTLRIIFTLLIEAIVFRLFGFRERRSWFIFILINLVTQGLLNIWINTFPFSDYQLYLTMILAEILIIIAEETAFLLLLKEHKRFRIAFYVLAANVISFQLGGYIISALSY